MSKSVFGMRQILLLVFLLIMCTVLVAADGPSWIGAFFVKGKVGLKWNQVDGASEYRVYRMASGKDYQVLLSLAKTHHFDTDILPGTTYKYKIAAVMGDGSELFSTEKTVSIPGSSVGEFSAPTWSGVRVDRGKVFLNWDKVGGAMAYNIYRSMTTGEGFEIVGNASGTRYADKDGLEKGATYYYVLTAINEEFEETEYSEERTIKFGMSAEEMAVQTAVENQIVLEDIKLTYLFDITSGKDSDMNQPAEVAINSTGDIYITDALNKKINCFDATGQFKFAFGEATVDQDKDQPPDGSFSYPFSIFIDGADRIYVGDVENHDIQVFSADGKFIKRIVVTATGEMNPLRPNGIHVLDDGRIVCTDAGNHRFLIIDQDGKVLLEKGSRGPEPGQFIFPDGITVTKDNAICVVDVINARVQMFDLEGNFLRQFGQTGTGAGQFGRPKVITEGEDGRLWISDALGNTIQVFAPDGNVKSVISKFDRDDVFLATPRGMVIKNGRLYVINRLPHRLMVFQIG